MKELRVYVASQFDFDEDIDINSVDNETFMDMAEKNGNVFSLKGFEREFNNDGLVCPYPTNDYIRFIEVDNFN